MIFDRIIEDVLGFIRRLLWWRSGKDTSIKKPFASMRTIDGVTGVIMLVEGRDTPRAIRSWIYSPKRINLNSTKMVAGQALQDLHIHLDFLGPIAQRKAATLLESPAPQRKPGARQDTHRLQILKASHFLNQEGFYDYELVFWQDCDFYLPIQMTPDRLAQIAVDKLAYACLNVANPLELTQENWEAMVQEIWQATRKSYFPEYTTG